MLIYGEFKSYFNLESIHVVAIVAAIVTIVILEIPMSFPEVQLVSTVNVKENHLGLGSRKNVVLQVQSIHLRFHRMQ